MKKLPIGIQTFSKIIESDYAYVDKTPLAFTLAQNGGYFFLSRPRRFGKSLFLDTLQELFEANEALFRNLFIHPHWDWSVKYPVIKLSFGGGVIRDNDDCREKIISLLQHNAQRHQVHLPTHSSIREQFTALIQQVHARYGRKVVILVDEYDKPILDRIEQANGSGSDTLIAVNIHPKFNFVNQ